MRKCKTTKRKKKKKPHGTTMAKMFKRVEHLMDKLEKVSEYYDELDHLTSVIVHKRAGATGPLTERIELVDHFEEKNIRWKSTCFKQYEIVKRK